MTNTDPRFIDRTGEQHGEWTILSYTGRRNGKARWLCQCLCGTQRELYWFSLQRQHTRSCGCVRRNMTHGASVGYKTNAEYNSYRHAKARCSTPTHADYHNYGGRGIEFRFASYEDFIEELGPKPSPHHSINRINNNGHYEKGNVEWATSQIQNTNRRDNKFLTWNNITQTVSQWAHTLGIRQSIISGRLSSNWCVECALTLPVREVSDARRRMCNHG